MSSFTSFSFVFFYAWLTIGAGLSAQTHDKIGPALLAGIQTAPADTQLAVWVFFNDKGPDVAVRLQQAKAHLTEAAYQRRLRRRSPNTLVDEFDVPVYPDYANQVAAFADRIRHHSRWLNAVSVAANPAALRRIAELDFVMKLDLVHSSKLRYPEPAPDELPGQSVMEAQHTLDYGQSLFQNELINVPAVHDMGYDGSGVLICMMDTGANNLEHETLRHLDLVAMRDFVNGDDNVDDEPGQMGNGGHGTQTLSVIAGFKEGVLIGPAYGASFLLAKTENTESEMHVEEDNWVAAAEWADSLGADIISSSLIYRDGFADGNDYSWQDMDGQTAIVTIGAEIAASRGILVVNSAGNDGPALEGSNTIGAPCDGENVLCVGAVTINGERAGFSSMGPTTDGRTKPDVAAMGSSVVAARTTAPENTTKVAGTSFSCPLAAGAAALLLQANPALTIHELMDGLRMSASSAFSPNNEIGWGIIDVAAALSVTHVAKHDAAAPSSFTLHPAYPNPFNPQTTIRYELAQASAVRLVIYNMQGQVVRTLVDANMSAGLHRVVWDGKDKRGISLSSGVYVYRLELENQALSRRVLFLK